MSTKKFYVHLNPKGPFVKFYVGNIAPKSKRYTIGISHRGEITMMPRDVGETGADSLELDEQGFIKIDIGSVVPESGQYEAYVCEQTGVIRLKPYEGRVFQRVIPAEIPAEMEVSV